jgi:hypothetical protein
VVQCRRLLQQLGQQLDVQLHLLSAQRLHIRMMMHKVSRQGVLIRHHADVHSRSETTECDPKPCSPTTRLAGARIQLVCSTPCLEVPGHQLLKVCCFPGHQLERCAGGQAVLS